MIDLTDVNPRELSRMAAPKKCGARRRQQEGLCEDWAAPLSGVNGRCRRHGGYTQSSREVARRLLNAYMERGDDPQWIKNHAKRRYDQTEARISMRKAKRAGPEFVAALLREREAWKAAERREAADRKAERRARVDNYNRERRHQQEPVASAPIAYTFDVDWEV